METLSLICSLLAARGWVWPTLTFALDLLYVLVSLGLFLLLVAFAIVMGDDCRGVLTPLEIFVMRLIVLGFAIGFLVVAVFVVRDTVEDVSALIALIH